MLKRWDGIGHDGREEFFTFMDMNRCEYNANIIAEEAGVPTVQFIETTHASQFRYDEAQKLEDLTKAIADRIGLSIGIENSWTVGRRISYLDFERWESNLFACYKTLGGVGERVESHQFVITAHATLFADGWQGTGPYYYDLTMPAVHPGRDAIVYVDHNATPIQRMAEVNAILRPVILADRRVRIYALSLKPRVNIPIKLTVGSMQMSETITLGTSWSGSGPWKQTVTLQHEVADAIVGTCEETTDAMAEEITKCGICVSGLDGTSLELTALFACPEHTLKLGAVYNESEVVD
ncbi:MAG: hypothetical protein E7Z65_06470 [Thermoplasmata archaeon]|nr:hypothetical protein [Thermoplasmata archaeon]